jgi:predicted DNA-binding transcriptional regulator AlpA
MACWNEDIIPVATRSSPLERLILARDLPPYDCLRETRRDELIAAGKYPPPIKLSDRRKAWLEREIVEWQRSKIAGLDYTFSPEARARANGAANEAPEAAAIAQTPTRWKAADPKSE